MRSITRSWVARLAAVVFASTLVPAPAGPSAAGWIRSWGVSPMMRLDIPELKDQLLEVKGQTLRERIRLSAGARQVRVRLSNEFGTHPLRIGAASIAVSAVGSAVSLVSVNALRFGGLPTITIPPGAPAVSDPMMLSVEPLTELTISLFLPEVTPVETVHYTRPGQIYLSVDGDFTKTERMPLMGGTISGAFLTGIDVVPAAPTQVIVTMGDSITDGAGGVGWPSHLAERLATARESLGPIAVVNTGIGGNRLLRDGSGASALARFDRDVLAVPGVSYLILLEGINDIGWPGARATGRQLAPPEEAPDAQAIIGGYEQLIARAHMRRLKVFGATLLPFAGIRTTQSGFYSADKERVRRAVNTWIRSAGEFDGVFDFDATMRDPDDPSRLLPAYDSGDNLHPGATGSGAMANAVPLGVFRRRSCAPCC
jgi:lysophospholipase L1-like esterase